MNFSRRLLLLILACAAFGAQAQTYRWTDKEGRVHYTDTPPPPSAVKAEEKNLRGNVATGGDLPFATQEAMKKYPVRLYTADECASCPDARALLQKRGIPFREINVKDEATHAELKRVTKDERVPALAVGSDVRVGFEAGGWNGALNAAGYPASASLPSKAKAPVEEAPTKPAAEAAPPPGPYTPR